MCKVTTLDADDVHSHPGKSGIYIQGHGTISTITLEAIASRRSACLDVVKGSMQLSPDDLRDLR